MLCLHALLITLYLMHAICLRYATCVNAYCTDFFRITDHAALHFSLSKRLKFICEQHRQTAVILNNIEYILLAVFKLEFACNFSQIASCLLS